MLMEMTGQGVDQLLGVKMGVCVVFPVHGLNLERPQQQ